MKTLLWTHLATTGLDPVEDAILEMYMKVTDVHGKDVNGERAFYSGLPRDLGDEQARRLNQPDSLRIHARSGLLTDYQQGRQHTFDNLDGDVLDCLNELEGDIWLAGYSPRFIYEFMRYATPRSHAKLHFQQMDLTSIEEFLWASFGQNVFKRPEALRVKAKVDSALEQYRTYLGLLEHMHRGLS